MAYAESASASGHFFTDLGFFNVTSHPPPDGFEQAVHLVAFALGDQFDSAVRQVPHVAGDRESAGDFLRRVTKPHALNGPRIVYTFADDHAKFCVAVTR